MKPIIIILAIVFALASCSKKDNQIQQPPIQQWDSKYKVEGTLTDFTEPVITYAGPQEFHLTKNGNKVEVICKELGINGHLISHGGSLSYYSKFGLILTIDPSSNKIISIENSYGQPSSNGRSAILDPSGVNSFNPATKTIKIKYWMDQTGVSGHKTAFDETWTYLGPK